MDLGVVLQTTPPSWRVVELAKRAEQYGFSHVWTFDSHILWQEPYVIYSQILAETRQVLVGPMVTNPGRDPAEVTICVAAPAYVGTDLDHQRDQTRWFGGMVGNHVADLVARYGASGDSGVPAALTDYIKGRQGYDYNEHGQAGNPHTAFVPDEIVDRFCLLGPVERHVERLEELKGLGVDQFAIYLQHDAKDETLAAYGERVMPAIAEHQAARS